MFEVILFVIFRPLGIFVHSSKVVQPGTIVVFHGSKAF